MSRNAPFSPKYGSGQNVTASGTSASITLAKGTKQVRVCNTGSTNPAQVRVGNGAQTATAADFHLPAGAIEVITKNEDDDTLAYISAAGTTLNVTLGEGW